MIRSPKPDTFGDTSFGQVPLFDSRIFREITETTLHRHIFAPKLLDREEFRYYNRERHGEILLAGTLPSEKSLVIRNFPGEKRSISL